ncbi:hypothetical protein BVRB_7g176480 [Beta vulgaris subsp. vulgaris]|nr:hypothetical protein BVRB_7g176480 [Beta vulgaris subsp. vulgaris]
MKRFVIYLFDFVGLKVSVYLSTYEHGLNGCSPPPL